MVPAHKGLKKGSQGNICEVRVVWQPGIFLLSRKGGGGEDSSDPLLCALLSWNRRGVTPTLIVADIPYRCHITESAVYQIV